jgi:dienelactone hydrolase
MTDVLLFHHFQGLTPGVTAFANSLRACGHTVHVPDMFDGRTFDSIEDGMAFVRESGGFSAVAARGRSAADGLSVDLVYAGFSLGVVPAQDLAQNRAGARGALFFSACMPAEEFGAWPEGLRAQVHGMEADPFFAEEEGDLDAAEALAGQQETVEVFLYPGDQHLFADSSLPSFDEKANALLIRRTLDFLASV